MIDNPPPWPGGARCAAAVTFDVDAESSLFAALPDTAHRRVSALSYFGYDQIAVPRITREYRRLGIEQTFFVPAWCMERYPAVLESILDGGHEIGLHGYIHELSYEHSSIEQERDWLGRSLELAERLTGKRPSGWRAPTYGFSEHTARVLAEAGFRYDSSLMGDDVPYLLDTPAGSIVELPVDWANDDWPQYVQSFEFDYYATTRAPDRAMEVFRAEVDAARAYGGLWIGVWHPAVTGRPARFTRVVALLEELLSAGDVWVATLDEIARHVEGLIARGEWTPRSQRMPPYPGPVPAALDVTGH
ncbi:polysaccharide deacetylase [Actinocorallia herbida]|uniref:Polysaccharide deacetylase n=1 Tax=Actinocorallia herbida TaxID=58109 RepID=A0A3N1CXP7_9ACTN|nr:polysaccharide deacetylase [Actinocorallia herbida]ROO86069.1 polysaccharide deacetylase [Actinocorallia herbida]